MVLIKNGLNKYNTLTQYLTKHNFDPSRTIFVGNDINDLQAMKSVGYPIAPADAHDRIKNIAKLILNTNGGHGVVRELANLLQPNI